MLGISILSWDLVILPTIARSETTSYNTLLACHVVVEDYAHTARAVVVHQFCHDGYFSFIGGGSVMAQDVPKYMMVAGERAVLRGLGLNIPNKFSIVN
ncbi:hypothetical protein TB1_024244 [Malus domestica]